MPAASSRIMMPLGVITVTIALFASAEAVRRAMKLEEFHRSLQELSSMPTSETHLTREQSSSASVANQLVTPLIFIPGFQGTILSHGSKPLFLAPMTPSTWQGTYDILRTAPNLDISLPHAVDYPAAACAPSPFSHIGHCLPLPALGPVNDLFTCLEKMGYKRTQSLHSVGYDWRFGIRKTLHDTSFTHDLTNIAERSPSPVLLVAHGYGCPLTAQFLSERPGSWCKRHISRLICAAAPLRESFSAKEAIRDGEGFLTAGTAHRYAGPAVNVRQKGRLDFRPMEFELGLRRGTRRDHLPNVSGPWDEKEDSPAAPSYERKKLASMFESLREMSTDISTRPISVPISCVVGIGMPVGDVDGDGVVERKSASKCGEWEGAELVTVNATHFNLTAMVGGLIQRLGKEDVTSR